MTATDTLRAIEIEKRLWVCARMVAEEGNAEFSVPCAQNVKDFIRAGAKNMLRESRTTEPDLEEAEKNLTKLVSGMVKSPMGVESRSGGVQLLREGALVVAKRLCPLWPFS
jgi:hypothetical protein